MHGWKAVHLFNILDLKLYLNIGKTIKQDVCNYSQLSSPKIENASLIFVTKVFATNTNHYAMEKNIRVYWVVIILIITISVFVFIETSKADNSLVQYLSFAGSITSLVLGLIAIFYSIITNQQSTENFGKLSEAVSKIEKGAKVISSVSANINSRLDKISNDITKISTKEEREQVISVDTFTTDTNVDESNDTNTPDQ